MKKPICPQCGRPTLETKEIEIRELDRDFFALSAPEKITELECKECGWFATKPQPVL